MRHTHLRWRGAAALDVGTGAKCAACASENHRANLRILFDAIEVAENQIEHFRRQRVELLGAVQTQRRNRAVQSEFNIHDVRLFV
ncbi:Ni,Fe-hydrogenase I small subunit [Paraburkholderia sp. MM5482-R1]